ncbi:MAG: hypothetical protein Q7U26_07075 [Aquabacterium sp.]|nr:hypothetical protein [Aquabacterium sp.]
MTIPNSKLIATWCLPIALPVRCNEHGTLFNRAFDDHPNAQRPADHIETVTADSVFGGLQRRAPGVTVITVR